MKLMVSLGMLLTFPLQFFVPIQIMLPSVQHHFEFVKRPLLVELVFRTTLVLFICEYSIFSRYVHSIKIRSIHATLFCSRRRRTGAESVTFHLADRCTVLVRSGAGISAADPHYIAGHRPLAVDDQELCDILGGTARICDGNVHESVEFD